MKVKLAIIVLLFIFIFSILSIYTDRVEKIENGELTQISESYRN